MAKIKTEFLERCLGSLELAFEHLLQENPEEKLYDVYRAACTKEFELILEQSGKLINRILRPFFVNKKELDYLTFKDSFRHATKHGIITPEESERWLNYRDYRNETAHEYGDFLADKILKILPQFIIDSKSLISSINEQNEI